MSKVLLASLFLSLATGASAALPVASGEFIHDTSISPGCNGLVSSSSALGNGDVIFGGNFTRCGTVRANRVVGFDGSNFYSLGAGAENGVNGVVRTVFVQDDRIYVGGKFSKAGTTPANNVAVFDGATWRSVGRGSSNGVPGGQVRALQVIEGKLYVGGHTDDFAKALLHEWNGVSWREVVAFAQTNLSDSVNALTVYNGTLYFGGAFRPVAFGTHQNIGLFGGGVVSYSDFLPSLPSSFNRVRDLHVFQNQLCVAGSFSLEPNTQGGVACRGPNGWQSFGLTSMRALTDDGSTLYAAGFDLTGSGSVHAIGLGSFVRTERTEQDYILTVVPHGGGLLVGGSLAQTITPAHGLLRLSQGQFTPLTAGNNPSLASSLDQFVAAGNTALGLSYLNQPHPAPSPSLLQRVGTRWEMLAAPGATDLESSQLLQAGGSLFLADHSARALFRWQPSGWQQVGANVDVNQSFGDQLIVVNSPNLQGARQVHRLGKNGMEPFFQIPPLRRDNELLAGSVVFPLSLIEFQGKPVIAGQFDTLDGVGPVHGVAILENGVWSQLGGGLSDPKWVNSERFLPVQLLAMNNQLYAAGGFTQAEGAPVDGIARFDGSRWQPLGAGLLQSDAVAGRAQLKLIGYNDKLYAYGTFDRANGELVHNIAQWDGSDWRMLGPAANDGIQEPGFFSAAVVGGELHLSGEIHAAGGEPAAYYAIWRDNEMFRSGFE